jgi:carbonic anhydrase
MQKLVDGIRHFQRHVFAGKRELFERLGAGQTPTALFITCADSRINPNLLTQTEPGDIFVLRNAGNIVPPAPDAGGEVATIEFAVTALGIADVVVCGHSDCGAIKALLDPPATQRMPRVRSWLRHARPAAARTGAPHEAPAPRALGAMVESNVLAQLDNLRTHEFLRERLATGALRLHGWVYEFPTGVVTSYDERAGRFVPLAAGGAS